MSFTGDLEHLPIVDVIQLLHATRKSGILRVCCRKGESQLVFKDGFIVSANHLNNSVRIGQILVDLGLISPEILDSTLEDQKSAGKDRKPLIITLIEKGLVKEGDAYRGLEQLIEMTLVEILSWKGGTFMLDVMPQSVADEYRYFPEKMSREINVDTQGILMNALRIFDEKVRDGEIVEDDSLDDDPDLEFNLLPAAEEEESPIISADLLGLDELDHLQVPPPDVYTVLEDKNPTNLLRRELEREAPELSPTELERISDFLMQFSPAAFGTNGKQPSAAVRRNIIFFSSDGLLRYSFATLGKKIGVHLFATNEVDNLAPVIHRSTSDGSSPILLLDSPSRVDAGFTPEKLVKIRSGIREENPRIKVIQLAAPDETGFALESYHDGVDAVIPRPLLKQGRIGFAEDFIAMLRALSSRMLEADAGMGMDIAGIKECVTELRSIKGAPEAAFCLLKFVARWFDRAVTLVVREKELVAEKGVGIRGEGSRCITPNMGFRLPLSGPSLMDRIIREGHVFYGNGDDPLIGEQLFKEIGEPLYGSILLLPLRLQGKAISITYGDFGSRMPGAVDAGIFELLADCAETALENAVYRKKIEKPAIKE